MTPSWGSFPSGATCPYAVDLGFAVCDAHPEELRDLLGTVYRLTAAGGCRCRRAPHYPLVEAATAIRVMGNAEHTGKLRPPHYRPEKASLPTASEQAQVFVDSSTIITGGLGRAGRNSLAERMATDQLQPDDHRSHPADAKMKRSKTIGDGL